MGARWKPIQTFGSVKVGGLGVGGFGLVLPCLTSPPLSPPLPLSSRGGGCWVRGGEGRGGKVRQGSTSPKPTTPKAPTFTAPKLGLPAARPRCATAFPLGR